MKKIAKKKIPKFSIITVVKNDEKGIKKTIDSISKQSFKNFEYLVIDGKSTDNTIKILKQKRKNIHKFISEKDNGIYDAMNKGVSKCNGSIILFVNSGDYLTKKALFYVNEIFKENKSIDFVFGTVKRYYTANTILKYGYNRERLKYNFDFATAHSTGFFFKKKSFLKVGMFNIKYKCSADYDLYYRAIITHKMNGGYTKKNNLVGIVSKGGFSSKVSFLEHLLEETKIRINNKQNIVIVFLIFANALIKFFLKKIKIL